MGYDADVFDGDDAAHAGARDGTTDRSGRFIPYWNRLTGHVTLDPLTDMDTSDYYVQPKSEGHAVVVKPYPYAGKLMTSFVAPVFKDGRAVGIGGNDYVLSALDAADRQDPPAQDRLRVPGHQRRPACHRAEEVGDRQGDADGPGQGQAQRRALRRSPRPSGPAAPAR